jgi:hypothetical protein
MALDSSPDSAWEVSKPGAHRYNVFQLFFVNGNHRECGLLNTTALPPLPEDIGNDESTMDSNAAADDLGDDESDQDESDVDMNLGAAMESAEASSECSHSAGDRDQGQSKSDAHEIVDDNDGMEEALIGPGDVIEYYDPLGFAENPIYLRTAVVTAIDPSNKENSQEWCAV